MAGNYVKARYGHTLPQVAEAWKILANTVYDPSYTSLQEGTTESVLCARPALRVDRVSTWGSAQLAYDAEETERALGLMLEVADKFRGCNNFEYDLVDIARQAVADRRTGCSNGSKPPTTRETGKIPETVERLSGPHFVAGQPARFPSGIHGRPLDRIGDAVEPLPAEQDYYRWNARTLLTTWGNRHAANVGGLHDYAHREWSGMLRDFYYPRWKTFSTR